MTLSTTATRTTRWTRWHRTVTVTDTASYRNGVADPEDVSALTITDNEGTRPPAW